jgi:hypothetical protein
MGIVGDTTTLKPIVFIREVLVEAMNTKIIGIRKTAQILARQKEAAIIQITRIILAIKTRAKNKS